MAEIKALISLELTRHGSLRHTERSLQDSTEKPTSIRILHLVGTCLFVVAILLKVEDSGVNWSLWFERVGSHVSLQ